MLKMVRNVRCRLPLTSAAARWGLVLGCVVGWMVAMLPPLGLAEQEGEDELDLQSVVIFENVGHSPLLNVSADGRRILAYHAVAGTYVISEDYPFVLLAPFNEAGLAPAATPREGVHNRDYGMVNTDGEWVVAAEYDSLWLGEDGFVTVKRGDEMGLLNPRGEVVVEVGRYPRLSHYADGVCAFQSEDGRWGLLDGEGQVVLEPVLETSRPPWFSDGLALIEPPDGPYTYINHEGRVEFQLEDVKRAESFREGRARIEVEQPWEEPPPLLISPEIAEELSEEELEQMREFDPPKSRTGYIDREGEVVFEPKWGDAGRFTEGLAAVCRLNPSNPWEVEANDDPANLRYGYIDREGNVVIDYQFEIATPFSSGLALVERDERVGYINRKGELVIDYNFSLGRGFRGDLAVVWDDGDVMVINRSGEVLSRQNWDNLRLNGPQR